MAMNYLTLKPILGTKNNCPIDSMNLVKPLDKDGLFWACHDTGGKNFDLEREDDACSKAFGRAQWSNIAAAQTTKCLGLHELWDGTNRNHIYFDNGHCYIFDSSRNPRERHDYLAYDAQSGNFTVGLEVEDKTSGATAVIVADDDQGADGTLWLSNVTGTFGNDNNIEDTGSGAAVIDGTLGTLAAFAVADSDLYSIITYGTSFVIADHGTTTPYVWAHEDDTLTKLIDTGDEFVFRYLLNFTNRIIGLYSGETNGDIDIRYTDALLPTEFPAANQLYKEGDSITGAHTLGHNTAFIFSETDIYRMDHYPSLTPVFSLLEVLKGWGSVNHQCIVSDGIYLYFYDQHRGFCRFDGSREPLVISQDYEGMISRIPTAYSNLTTSTWIPFSNEIAWSIPVDNDIVPSKIIYYNTKTGQWRHEDKAGRCLDIWRYTSDIIWNELIILTDDVWPTPGTWVHYASDSSKLVFGLSNGHLYTSTSEGDNASNWEGYRIEPILPFSDRGKTMIRLLEIWFGIAEHHISSLDIYWRGGDTTGELEGAAWTPLGSLSMASPDNPVLYVDQTARLHQIKWGTDKKSEPFSVSEIKFGYVAQGSY